jgi:succinyldiaminopimelate transaminase
MNGAADSVRRGVTPRRTFGVTGLPDFPWDTIADAKATASAHPEGIVDLSVGTPVDPTPALIAGTLAASSNAPGYPTTSGSVELRTAIADYLARTANSVPIRPGQVLPTIGSKELVAWLPTLLGLGSTDAVVIPELAYPTYAVGAHLAGAALVTSDEPFALTAADWPDGTSPALVWVNSPANPNGRIASVAELTRIVDWARANDVLVASDECYLPFCWDEHVEAVSVLDPRVNGGSTDGVLAVHSLSKRSNLAGYRAGFVAGDAAVVDALLAVRKHAGMIVPQPVQAALAAAVSDDEHALAQVTRYRARRDVLAPALIRAGFRIDDSQGALYLWVSLDEPCRDTVGRLAGLGILAAPGDFYGSAGGRHVRIALTATDERIAAAARRLDTSAPMTPLHP